MLFMEISNTVTKDPSGYHRKMMGKSGEDRPCTKGAQRNERNQQKGQRNYRKNFMWGTLAKKTGIRKNTRNFLSFSFLKHGWGNLLGVRYPRPKRWGNHEVTCPVPGGAIQKIKRNITRIKMNMRMRLNLKMYGQITRIHALCTKYARRAPKKGFRRNLPNLVKFSQV